MARRLPGDVLRLADIPLHLEEAVIPGKNFPKK